MECSKRKGIPLTVSDVGLKLGVWVAETRSWGGRGTASLCPGNLLPPYSQWPCDNWFTRSRSRYWGVQNWNCCAGLYQNHVKTAVKGCGKLHCHFHLHDCTAYISLTGPGDLTEWGGNGMRSDLLSQWDPHPCTVWSSRVFCLVIYLKVNTHWALPICLTLFYTQVIPLIS